MINDTITVNLVRKTRLSDSPDYSLTIYEDGKVMRVFVTNPSGGGESAGVIATNNVMEGMNSQAQDYNQGATNT